MGAFSRRSGEYGGRRAWGLALAGVLGVTPAGWAQGDVSAPPKEVSPGSESQATAATEELPVIPLKDGLKQLKRIRLKHFGQIRNTEIRQIGIAKLKKYNESKFYPHLLEIFAREGKDVRGAVLDLLEDQKDERADTTIAYGAVFDKDEWFREEAARRLMRRMAAYRAEQLEAEGDPDLVTPEAARGKERPIPSGMDSGIPWRVKAVLANGIRQPDDTVAAAAANLAADLKVYDLIPALINAQVQPPTTTGARVGSGEGSGALAYIMVGTQQAYVADLEPVVGDSAVGFDPTLGVVTSGTVMQVLDAVVVTYRTEVYYSLRRLANSGWDGRKTDKLGFDQRAWKKWYEEEFVPYRRAVAEGTAPEAVEEGPD